MCSRVVLVLSLWVLLGYYLLYLEAKKDVVWSLLHYYNCSSVANLCVTLCNPTDCSSQAPLSLSISWSLLRLGPIELVMPCNNHVLCHCGGDWVAKSCLALVTPWTVPTSLLCPWNSPGKNTRVGCHALLQGIFPTWELNPGLLHCRQFLNWLNCGLQIILEHWWYADYSLAIPFCQTLFYHKCRHGSHKAEGFYRSTGPIIFMMRVLFLLHPRKITDIKIGHLAPG